MPPPRSSWETENQTWLQPDPLCSSIEKVEVVALPFLEVLALPFFTNLNLTWLGLWAQIAAWLPLILSVSRLRFPPIQSLFGVFLLDGLYSRKLLSVYFISDIWYNIICKSTGSCSWKMKMKNYLLCQLRSSCEYDSWQWMIKLIQLQIYFAQPTI